MERLVDLEKYVDYVIHLLICALNNSMPNSVPEGISIKELFEFSRYHRLENILCYPLMKLELSEEEKREFDQYQMYSIVRDTVQEEALKEICGIFEEKGIPHMPLKGSVIKYLYPSTDMRQSADIDIYIGSQNAVDAKEIMLGLGYTTDETLFGLDADDAYVLGRYLRVELHRTLIPDIYKWKGECKRIEESSIRVEGKNYEYKMSDEDFYVYMIIHLAKHMHLTGSGIKSILDIWIYVEAYKEKLDWTFIDKSLKSCGLEKFEENVKTLAYMWFSGKDNQNPIINELAIHVAAGGWIGKDKYRQAKNIAENYSNKRSKICKLKYYFSCVFLTYDRMCKKYKILEKHKYLLPLFWGIRTMNIVLNKNDRIAAANDKLNNSQNEIDLGKQMLEFDKRIGL